MLGCLLQGVASTHFIISVFSLYIYIFLFLSPNSVTKTNSGELSESCCFNLRHSYYRVVKLVPSLANFIAIIEVNITSLIKYTLREQTVLNSCTEVRSWSCFFFCSCDWKKNWNTLPSEYYAVCVDKLWTRCSKIARLNVFIELWKQVCVLQVDISIPCEEIILCTI